MNAYGICERIAGLLAADSLFAERCQELYGKAAQITIGYDPRESPTDGDAPFVMLIPETETIAEKEFSAEFGIGIVAGIAESERDEAAGFGAMRGARILDEDILPSLRRVLRRIPGSQVVSVETEYVLEAFPLWQASMTAVLRENRPIGSRY